MAETYHVTGVHYSQLVQADGSYAPSIEVSYETKTTPVVHGTVVLPAGITSDKAGYVRAVKDAIEAQVAGHVAVLGL